MQSKQLFRKKFCKPAIAFTASLIGVTACGDSNPAGDSDPLPGDAPAAAVQALATTGARSQTQGCNIIPNVSATWGRSDNLPSSWQAAPLSRLADGNTDEPWFYYAAGNSAIPIVFTLPPGQNVTGVRWHDHYGAGNFTLRANASGQMRTISTNRWPLDWHHESWNLTGVTQFTLNIDSNDTKISEIQFCGPTATGGPTTPVSPVTQSPQGLDKYPATRHIIDSFGEAVAADTSGHQWNAVSSYYNRYYDDSRYQWRNQGMCSEAIHNSYWVLADENGKPQGSDDYDGDGDNESYYPTWHPPVHDKGGANECYFMHEHGENPALSNLYDVDDALSIGVPFGFVHSKTGNMSQRAEDHVGHKVVVQNDFTLVNGNPYNVGEQYSEIGVNCDWLSKLHQGGHSSDALGNNVHEYFLNVDCNDSAGTSVRTKELVTFGYPDRVYNEGSNNCSNGIQWFDAGFDADNPIHLPIDANNTATGLPNLVELQARGGASLVEGPFVDGKREFGCYADRIRAFHGAGAFIGQPKLLGELWKSDTRIATPDNSGSIVFSPYYITLNPSRYVDPNWQSRFAARSDTYLGRDSGAMVSSVDLCVRGSDAWRLSILAIHPEYQANNQYPGFCSLLDTDLRASWEQEIRTNGGDTAALSDARKHHVNNPFDSTKRGVHPKNFQVWADGSTTPNYQSMKLFCTDAFGESPQWPDLTNPDAPLCPTGTVVQAISPQTNQSSLSVSNGSSVGSRRANGSPQNPGNQFEANLQAVGEGGELVIDGIDDAGNRVRSPN